MTTLHILGNGFDLHHGLPTKIDPDLRNLATQYAHFPGEWDCYSSDLDLWSELEEGLAYPDVTIFTDYLGKFGPDYLSDRESDRDGIIVEADQLVNFPLEVFAENADRALESVSSQQKFQREFGPEDIFVTFNYTHTLQELYEVDAERILHLHGEVGVTPLILGYAPGTLTGIDELNRFNDEDNFDYYISTAYKAVSEKILDFEKQYSLPDLKLFIESYFTKLSRICVYGFSFGMVDKPYFQYLDSKLGDVPWCFRAYSESALDDMCGAFDSYECSIKYLREVF